MSGGGFESGIPSLLMQAAQSAAQADGLTAPDQSASAAIMEQMAAQQQLQQLQQKQAAQAAVAATKSKPNNASKKKGLPLRRGKWTPEEEAYANRLIQEFKAGLLPLTDGTTLRTFLSKLLNCDPMRISKKFVGSNCIGKQVFRRRTADLNRLTPEQIQKSRAELSELERRFLERVAQTNRVKSSGVAGGGAAPAAPVDLLGKKEDLDFSNAGHPPSPPWLQPPLGYKHGGGAAMAAANLVGSQSNSRAAAAGRALLEGLQPGRKSSGGLSSSGSAGLLANMLQNASAQNLLAAAAGSQGSTMAKIARTASAARMVGFGNGLGGGSTSAMNNLMLKTGFSHDQLASLARERGLSSASLSNMLERKNSFDALMSLDFQSLQSIDNLANLIHNGGSSGQAPSSGLKNGTWGEAGGRLGSSGSLSNAARRLASTGQMESLLRSLSSNNMRNTNSIDNGTGQSNSNLQSLLRNMQSSNSMSSLLGGNGNGASAASLANLLRENSSTGLSALRMQDGLNQRNSSVEDFLSLVAAGDIPHQDPSLLNIPLMRQQNNGSANNDSGGGDAAAMLAQQQLLAQATGNPALANALASRSLGNLRSGSASNLRSSSSAAELIARASGGSSLGLKRKLLELDGAFDQSGSNKR